MDDIAAQLGCPIQTLKRFAHDHGIPVRTRGTSIYIPGWLGPRPPSGDLPEPLHRALVGRRAQRRLDHLLVIAEQASAHEASP